MDNIRNGNTALHRAFSVFIFNNEDKLLLQQRAGVKITFPLHWTNTCCSHPLHIPTELTPESPVDGVKTAAIRKLEQELGIRDIPKDSLKFLTRILYKAESNGTWGEHEVDYILLCKVDQAEVNLDLNANEVEDVKYVSQAELKAMFEDTSVTMTPWFKLICEHFLFQWWSRMANDGLDSLTSDSTTIHNMA